MEKSVLLLVGMIFTMPLVAMNGDLPSDQVSSLDSDEKNDAASDFETLLSKRNGDEGDGDLALDLTLVMGLKDSRPTPANLAFAGCSVERFEDFEEGDFSIKADPMPHKYLWEAFGHGLEGVRLLTVHEHKHPEIEQSQQVAASVINHIKSRRYDTVSMHKQADTVFKLIHPTMVEQAQSIVLAGANITSVIALPDREKLCRALAKWLKILAQFEFTLKELTTDKVLSEEQCFNIAQWLLVHREFNGVRELVFGQGEFELEPLAHRIIATDQLALCKKILFIIGAKIHQLTIEGSNLRGEIHAKTHRDLILDTGQRVQDTLALARSRMGEATGRGSDGSVGCEAEIAFMLSSIPEQELDGV